MRNRLAVIGPWLIAVSALGLPCGAPADEVPVSTTPTPQRQQLLVRMVRQDCGACHGLLLSGGLGPALTRDALAGRSLAALVAATLHGRPGTPMPGWKSMLSEPDAVWIAQQLQAGFPAEPGGMK